MSSTRLGATILLLILASVIVWAGVLSQWDAASMIVVLGIVIAIAFLFLLGIRKKRS